jgi:hypothetical protein
VVRIGYRLVSVLICGLLAYHRLAGIPEGPAVYIFNDFPGVNWSVPVWTYRPVAAGPDAPIVFVCHGLDRNGRTYRNAWQDHAERLGFVLVVPEFTEVSFPGSRSYNQGNLFDSEGRPMPQNEWSFQVIERVFDDVVAKTQSVRQTYHLYGHSAGAQFVHRLLLLLSGARIDRAVSANAGWYTVPDTTVDYPYGLRNSPYQTAHVTARLAENHLVLLGTEDNDPNDPSLTRNATVDLQGVHRFERGHYFFDKARDYAAARGAAFGLTLAYAPGVGHSNSGIAAHAANWLMQPCRGVGLMFYTQAGEVFMPNLGRGLPSASRVSVSWRDNYTIPGLFAAADNMGTLATYRIHESSADGRVHQWRADTTSSTGFIGGRPNALTGAMHFGIRLTNNTGQKLNRLTVRYTGRQFHVSRSTVAGRLQVALRIGGTAGLTAGQWLAVPRLEFPGPQVGPANVQGTDLNPYAEAAFVRVPETTVAGFEWLPGTDLWIRWSQLADSDSSHGLGFDGVSIAAHHAQPGDGIGARVTAAPIAAGVAIRVRGEQFAPSARLLQSLDLATWRVVDTVLPVVDGQDLTWDISAATIPNYFRLAASDPY